MLINGQVVPSVWTFENNYDGGSYYCAPLRMSLVFKETTSLEMRAQQQALVNVLAATPDLYEACRAIIDAGRIARSHCAFFSKSRPEP